LHSLCSSTFFLLNCLCLSYCSLYSRFYAATAK
jgi:hypothetical protein